MTPVFQYKVFHCIHNSFSKEVLFYFAVKHFPQGLARAELIFVIQNLFFLFAYKNCLRTKIFWQENLTSSHKKTRPNFSYFSPLPKRFEWGHTVRIVAILEPHWILDRGRLVHIVVLALHFLLEMFDLEGETVWYDSEMGFSMPGFRPTPLLSS